MYGGRLNSRSGSGDGSSGYELGKGQNFYEGRVRILGHCVWSNSNMQIPDKFIIGVGKAIV